MRESINSIHHSIRLRDSIKPSSANSLQVHSLIKLRVIHIQQLDSAISILFLCSFLLFHSYHKPHLIFFTFVSGLQPSSHSYRPPDHLFGRTIQASINHHAHPDVQPTTNSFNHKPFLLQCFQSLQIQNLHKRKMTSNDNKKMYFETVTTKIHESQEREGNCLSHSLLFSPKQDKEKKKRASRKIIPFNLFLFHIHNKKSNVNTKQLEKKNSKSYVKAQLARKDQLI